MKKLDQLLVKSERLNTKHSPALGHSLNKPFHRGYFELEAVTLTRVDAGLHGKEDLHAAKLLAPKNFNLFKLADEVQLLMSEDRSVQSEEHIAEDIEAYLAHLHDVIVFSAIDQAKQASDEHIRRMQHNWLMHDWAMERDAFIDKAQPLTLMETSEA